MRVSGGGEILCTKCRHLSVYDVFSDTLNIGAIAKIVIANLYKSAETYTL